MIKVQGGKTHHLFYRKCMKSIAMFIKAHVDAIHILKLISGKIERQGMKELGENLH